ncbi:MAG TPA: helix-turn-helix transcriptional regulator [Bacillota bacterium]|nr:helix-turn-helix transcriptional regulator [Bacillota bacterium]
MNENDLKATFSKNLIHYRKALEMTQIQLAEKLNYSDKSVSKWERGESLPDLVIMTQLAGLFGVTLNDLVSDKKPKNIRKPAINRHLVSVMAAVSVWAVATGVYVFLGIFLPDPGKSWLTFIYAIPSSLIVLIIFYRMWGKKLMVFLFSSLTLWTLALSIFLSFDHPRLWLFFIAGIPLQILLVLWLILRPRKKPSLPIDLDVTRKQKGQ